MRKIPTNSRLVIEKDGVEANLIDVGVGISQVLPVVVACLNNVKTLISFEQPELHIHPRIRVGLGDLFIHCITKNSDLPDLHLLTRRNPQRTLNAQTFKKNS